MHNFSCIRHERLTMQAFITSAELAERLGVDRTTIVRRIDAGVLMPVAKLPGRTGAWLFDPAAFERVGDGS